MEKLNSSNIVMIISFYKLPKPCDKISRGKWVIMEKLNSSNIINLSQFYDNTYVAFTNFPYLACFYILGVSSNFETLDSG